MGNAPTPLRQSIRFGDTQEVEKILNKAGDRSGHLINNDFSQDCIFDSCTRAIGNSFYYAVSRNKIRIVEILIDKGADIYSTGRYGETCLHLAARNNFVQIGQILVKNGLDVKVTDDQGRYPIHSTCMTILNATQFIQFLLEEAGQREDVNLKDFHGRTALHNAAFAGNLEVIRVLLEYGADIHAADKAGNTPLHEARIRPAAAELLIANGADPNKQNLQGLTPAQMPR